jgi:hypothetical protein
MTAIDFSNAFGSVPQDLIMSTVKQLNFPVWIRTTIKDMYDKAKSKIEDRGRQTDSIRWRKGVKQECPLSPLLSNLYQEPLFEITQRDESIQ